MASTGRRGRRRRCRARPLPARRFVGAKSGPSARGVSQSEHARRDRERRRHRGNHRLRSAPFQAVGDDQDRRAARERRRSGARPGTPCSASPSRVPPSQSATSPEALRRAPASRLRWRSAGVTRVRRVPSVKSLHLSPAWIRACAKRSAPSVCAFMEPDTSISSRRRRCRVLRRGRRGQDRSHLAVAAHGLTQARRMSSQAAGAGRLRIRRETCGGAGGRGPCGRSSRRAPASSDIASKRRGGQDVPSPRRPRRRAFSSGSSASSTSVTAPVGS
jgi:hypothetical protein